MRAIQIRSVSLAALAVLAFAVSSASQSTLPTGLSSLEVQQLVARAEPNDHARLSAHFTALAERYERESRRHTTMSKGVVGNPSRNLATDMSAHCTRLAELSTQSATTVRALSVHHQKLALGAPSTLPPDGSRFQGGAGATEPTDKEFNAAMAKASTSLEHHIFEEYFLTLANRYAAAAAEHVALAQAYRGTRLASAAVHHDLLATLSRDSASEATEAAETHKRIAGLPR